MALSHDHPAYKKKVAAAKKAKAEILRRIYDPEQYSPPATHQNGCYRCKYYDECTANLWQVWADAQGIYHAPLRCFADHPEYDPDEWGARQLSLLAVGDES